LFLQIPSLVSANTPSLKANQTPSYALVLVDTDVAAAEEETCGKARALGSPGAVKAADTDVAAAEKEACGEACALVRPVEAATLMSPQPKRNARALGSPVKAADTDVAAAEEETCGKARALGRLVEAADSDVAAAEEEAYGEACAQGEAFEAPLTTLKHGDHFAKKKLPCSAEPQGIREDPNARPLVATRSNLCNN